MDGTGSTGDVQAVAAPEAGSFRVFARALRLSAVTLALYLAWEIGDLLLLATPRARRGWRRVVMRRWSRACCAALSVRIEVDGPRPSGGNFLVSNHLSYLDIVVLASVTDTVFVSKAEVRDWPAIGWLARRFGTIFVARERKRDLPEANRRIDEALAGGEGVVVFPEGTSTRGDKVLAFRPSLLAPAAERARPVRAACLHYATLAGDPPASLAVCWWGDAAFLPHLRGLLALRGVEATVKFDPDPVRESDRKELAEKLRRKVNSLFRPVP
jgi:1-acyl-sn-glycerol-3-phosphate acyltransferase